MEIHRNKVLLSNGISIPSIGYGTYQLDNAEDQIYKAIELGYRHIDSAAVYKNEELVGLALRKAIFEEKLVKREELFVTSKLADEDQGYSSALKAFDRTINNLQLDYLDLYLIHWPVPRGKEACYKELNGETWKAFEELYAAGKVKAIGVSNFLIRHIEQLKENSNRIPMVNQLELHPKLQQKNLVSYCNDNHILVEGWGPFRHGKIFEIAALQEIALRYKVTVAQLCIKWSLQRGIIPISKTSNAKRMLENQEVFNFRIAETDMKMIEELDTDTCYEDYWSYKRQQQY